MTLQFDDVTVKAIYKSHVRYCSLPRHNAFLCNAYYLMAEVVQKISNYKQKHAPSYIAIYYYLLVNVGRKRPDLVTNIIPNQGGAHDSNSA